MLYPPVADLLKKVDSRYLLVNLVAHRAVRSPLRPRRFRKICRKSP